MKKSGIHFASLDKSPRLQRALKALRMAPAGLTTRQWIKRADICACNSIAAELRRNGFKVSCDFEGRGAGGSSVFRYRLGDA